MKITTIIILLTLTIHGYGQDEMIGIYGQCDKDHSGYMCQQVKFNPDSTFLFYNLMHLSGWTVSEGTWRIKKDTLILNSNPYHLTKSYFGFAKKDSITVNLTDCTGVVPFAEIKIDTQKYIFNLDGSVKVPKLNTDTFYISYLDLYRIPIPTSPDLWLNSDTLSLTTDNNLQTKVYFENEK